MEPVSANHITRLKTTPDIDKKILTVEAHTATGNPSAVVSVVVSEGGKVVATGKAMQGQPVHFVDHFSIVGQSHFHIIKERIFRTP